jgi:pyruvate dehydrogenase (quinone)
MSRPVADYVLQRLTEWGVHRIYGYPGDGINGFLGAFDRAEGRGARARGRLPAT